MLSCFHSSLFISGFCVSVCIFSFPFCVLDVILLFPHCSSIFFYSQSLASQLPLLPKLQKPCPTLEVAHPLLYHLPPLLLLPLLILTLRRAGRQRSGCCLPCWRTRPGGFMPTRPSCSSAWLWVSGSWTQPLSLLGLEFLPPNKPPLFPASVFFFALQHFPN